MLSRFNRKWYGTLQVDRIEQGELASGITFGDEVNMDDNKIINLGTPTADSDAATKAYVDGATGGSGGGTKGPVRATTVDDEDFNTGFQNGSSIDGVTLATGDRILIKNQSTGSENGIYTVNASGAPTRATDLDTGDSASGVTVFVAEGNLNNGRGYMCTNAAASDTVGTDSLTFERITKAGDNIVVNDFTELRLSILNEEKHIRLLPATYTFLSPYSLDDDEDNTFFEGSGIGLTVLQGNGTATGLFTSTGAPFTNITFRDMTLDLNNASSGTTVIYFWRFKYNI